MVALVQRVGSYRINFRSEASASLFSISDVAYDYALAGVPFVSGLGQEGQVYRRSFMPIRKEQFDNSPDPGEQMLGDWWYRSQSSWHLGTGIKFQEPAQADTNAFRFQESRGIDPWTPGRLSLLRETTNEQTITEDDVPFVRAVKNGADDAVLLAHGATLRIVSDAANTTITAGNSTDTIVALADDGSNYFVRAGAIIYSGTLPVGAGAAQWNGLSTPNQVGAMVYPMEYVKHRLIVADVNNLYELVGLPDTPPVAIGTPVFTHPNDSWRWTAIAEGPNAIYVAGTDGRLDANGRIAGTASIVYKIQVNQDDGTLGSPVPVFTLPRGEYATSIVVHLGVVAVGTNKGVRVGKLDAQVSGASGDFIIEGPAIEAEGTGAVRALAARDRFIYAACTCDSPSGLLRIDVTTEIEPGLFPWTHDLQAAAGSFVAGDEVVGVCSFGSSDRMAFATQSVNSTGALWVEHASNLVSSGHLLTGNVRFNTLEDKIFRYVNARTDGPLQGSLAVAYVAPGGSTVPLITIGAGSGDVGDVRVADIPFQYAAFKFTLQRNGSDPTAGAEMIGWQVKALPWTPRIVTLEFPLLCFDFERDRNNTLKGFKGYALARLEAVEKAASTGAPVVFQDFVTGRSFVTIVEDYQFTQLLPPEKKSGFGGVANFRLRVVT